MNSWFLDKQYPEKGIEKGIRKIKFYEKQIKTAKWIKGVLFVVTHRPQLKPWVGKWVE